MVLIFLKNVLLAMVELFSHFIIVICKRHKNKSFLSRCEQFTDICLTVIFFHFNVELKLVLTSIYLQLEQPGSQNVVHHLEKKSITTYLCCMPCTSFLNASYMINTNFRCGFISLFLKAKVFLNLNKNIQISKSKISGKHKCIFISPSTVFLNTL